MAKTPRERKTDPQAHELGNAAGDAPALGDDRHYLHDSAGLLDNEHDEDERAADDLLELDQTELEELGLLLDDPHQPEAE